MATATRHCMITDISRSGLAIALYPFFAGAVDGAVVLPVGLPDARCAAAPIGGGVISAVSWNTYVCTAVFFSSCFDSLISTFWKYPERFSAVMKLATPLT